MFMSSHEPPLPLSGLLRMLLLLRMPRLYCAASGRLLALYHSQLMPMLIRFAMKYQRSHSRRMTVLRLKPGDEVEFVLSDNGQVMLQNARQNGEPRRPDRFDRALGSAPLDLGCSVDEYMRLIRGGD